MWFEDLKAFLCEEICQSIYETARSAEASGSRKKDKTQESGASGLIFQARGSAFSLFDSVLFLGLHGKMVFGILL